MEKYQITKISPVKDKVLNLLSKSALELFLLLSFSLGFVLEVLLYIRYTIKFNFLYDGFIAVFNVFYFVFIIAVAVSFLISIYNQLKNPIKKNYTVIIFLLMSLFFLNLTFVIVLIKNLQKIVLTLFDVILLYTIFSIGIIMLGITLVSQIILRYRLRADYIESYRVMKISSISIGLVVICSAILLINASLAMFSGSVSAELISYAGQLELSPLRLLINLAIIGGSIVVALFLFVFPRTRVLD